MGDEERPTNCPAVPEGRDAGMKWRKPFSPNVRKIRPRRKRAMTMVIFMLRFVN
jgi:hypothetical protein